MNALSLDCLSREALALAHELPSAVEQSGDYAGARIYARHRNRRYGAITDRGPAIINSKANT